MRWRPARHFASQIDTGLSDSGLSDSGLSDRRFYLGVLGALALIAAPLITAPLAAQERLREADQALKDLIPDSALDKPEEWAKAPPVKPAPTTAPVAPATTSPVPPLETWLTGDTLKPDSPMADIPGLTLPWPDATMAPMAPLEADPDSAKALAEAMTSLPEAARPAGSSGTADKVDLAARETVLAGGKARLVWPAGSFAARGALEARFRTLSALQAMGSHEADALTQVVVRGASDRKLLEKLLRVYGYYDGEVIETLIPPSRRAAEDASGLAAESVRYDLDPGQLYRIGMITSGDLDQTGRDADPLGKALGLHHGDPLGMDSITAAATRLDNALGEAGYPFAVVPTPSLTVDHARYEGDVELAVKAGGKYRFGTITSNLPRFMSAHHLGVIARFKVGQAYKKSEIEDLRRAILATGLVAGVAVTPREAVAPAGERPGVVALDVVMSKAPLRTIAGEIGYDTGEGFRVAASWEHRNLFPPEGALKFRTIVGTNEQLLGTTFRRSNFLGRDRVLSVDLYADNANLAAYAARKVAFAVSQERVTNVLFQKPWTWSMGIEAQASEEREGVPSGVTKGRILYVTAALPLRAGIDSTDDLLDPTRGHRLSLRISPEHGWARETQASYARAQADISGYWNVKAGTILAARARLGTLAGTNIDNVAPSRRLYAGGGASLRGFGYQLVGPRNASGEPKGGRSLYEFSLEARINTPLFNKALQVVPFVDAGGVEAGVTPRFNDWRIGAGLGIRYRTGFGPIRVDIGTPLNPRAGDSRIGVYVALGQAF